MLLSEHFRPFVSSQNLFLHIFALSFVKTTIEFSIEEQLLREVTMWKESIKELY